MNQSRCRTTRRDIPKLISHYVPIFITMHVHACAPKCLIEGAKAVVSQARLEMKDVAACGIGSPGLLDLEEGVVIAAANFPSWANVNVCKPVAEALGLEVRACVHAFMRTCMRSCVHSCIRYVHALACVFCVCVHAFCVHSRVSPCSQYARTRVAPE